MGSRAHVSLDTLRATIRALEGHGQVVRQRVPTGIPAIDRLLGGLPRPGVVELCGALGSGTTRLAASLCAAAFRGHQRAAWVDAPRTLHPPGLVQLDPMLQQLLFVRPVADGSHQEWWAAEQLCASGCFGLVVLDLADPQTLPAAKGAVWARAAERGRCTLVVLSQRPQRNLSADVRLWVSAHQVQVLRARGEAPVSRGSELGLPVPDGHEITP